MQSLALHYAQLLGLPATWKVDDVNLSINDKKVEIRLIHTAKNVQCPKCGESCGIYDHGPEQKWRHLDTMQFETILIARLPRCNCKQDGVKTTKAPWADKHSRFSLLFEGIVIKQLKHGSNAQAVANLVKLNWNAVNQIMRQAVERGLSRRNMKDVKRLGMDEKSFKVAHHYVTTLNDLDGGRVLEVVDTRTAKASEELLNSLAAEERGQIKSVAMDMWKPFARSVEKVLPKAAIVHDRFHVSKYLNEAVDTIRRKESRELNKAGNPILNGTKYLWLKNPEKMTEKQSLEFEGLLSCKLQTPQAWLLKNMFRGFWDMGCPDAAATFFGFWCKRVDELGLKPLLEVKAMLKRHLPNILNYFSHKTSNAVSEGLNNNIQLLKASARGFHSFASYRVRILFHCGKLDMAIR